MSPCVEDSDATTIVAAEDRVNGDQHLLGDVAAAASSGGDLLAKDVL